MHGQGRPRLPECCGLRAGAGQKQVSFFLPDRKAPKEAGGAFWPKILSNVFRTKREMRPTKEQPAPKPAEPKSFGRGEATKREVGNRFGLGSAVEQKGSVLPGSLGNRQLVHAWGLTQ